MRLTATVKYDITLQFRHGFYYAYMIISALYIVLIRSLPVEIKEPVLTLIIFSDPSILGFYFIGGIILLEKGQNTMECLFVTPIKIYEYMFSKIISLTFLALLTSFVITISTVGLSFNPFSLFVGVSLCSIFFILMGISISAYAKTLNHYIFISAFCSIVFCFPFLDYLKIFSFWGFYLFPTKPALILINSAFNTISLSQAVYAVFSFIIWILLAYRWAYRWFEQYVVFRVGGDR